MSKNIFCSGSLLWLLISHVLFITRGGFSPLVKILPHFYEVFIMLHFGHKLLHLLITPGTADKLLPVASRGDIEGAILAILLNLVILGLISFGIVKFIKLSQYLIKEFHFLDFIRYFRKG